MVSINTNCYVAFPGNTIRVRRGKRSLNQRNCLLHKLYIQSYQKYPPTLTWNSEYKITDLYCRSAVFSFHLSSNSPLLLTSLSKFILVNFYQRCVLFQVKFVCSPSMDGHIVLSNIGLSISCLKVGMFPSCRVAKDREVFGLEKWKETHCLHTVLPTYYKIASWTAQTGQWWELQPDQFSLTV